MAKLFRKTKDTDLDTTAPFGAVWSGSAVISVYLNCIVNQSNPYLDTYGNNSFIVRIVLPVAIYSRRNSGRNIHRKARKKELNKPTVIKQVMYK